MPFGSRQFPVEWPPPRSRTMKRMMLGLVLTMLTVPLLSQQPPKPAGPPKIQTLIITGQQTGHDWKAVTPELRKALEATGLFEVRIMEEFRGAGPETLAPYQLVVLNYQDAPPRPALGRAGRQGAAGFRELRQGRRHVPLRRGGLQRVGGVREALRLQLASEPGAPLGRARLRRGHQGLRASHHQGPEEDASAAEGRTVRQPEMPAGGFLPRAGHGV